jgi:hypothetical protein
MFLEPAGHSQELIGIRIPDGPGGKDLPGLKPGAEEPKRVPKVPMLLIVFRRFEIRMGWYSDETTLIRPAIGAPG